MAEKLKNQVDEIVELSNMGSLNHISSGPNQIYLVDIGDGQCIHISHKEILNTLAIVRAIEKYDNHLDMIGGIDI